MKTNLSSNCPTRVALLAAFIGAVEASAGVSLISQNRTLDASAEAIAGSVVDGPHAESLAAPGFGVFNEAIEPFALAISISGNALVASAQGVAKQNSSLGLTAFTAQGVASVSLTLLPPSSVLSGEASAESFFEVFFSIDEPMQFSLSGSVDTQAITTGGAGDPALDNEVALVRTDDNTLIYSSGANDGNLLGSGPLAPGNYRLWAQAEVSATQVSSPLFLRTVSGISEFDFQMLVSGIPETSTYVSALGLMGLVAMAGFRCARR